LFPAGVEGLPRFAAAVDVTSAPKTKTGSCVGVSDLFQTDARKLLVANRQTPERCHS
jgi:hypothetical protein